MLLNNKINLFSFLFGKRYSPNMPKVSNWWKAHTIKNDDLTDSEGRINIAKSEDFYVIANPYVNSPFAQLNK